MELKYIFLLHKKKTNQPANNKKKQPQTKTTTH